MEKGILLLALGHAYYGRMATMLAASIRAYSDIPIHLIYSGEGMAHFGPKEKALFTSFHHLPHSEVVNGCFRIKTLIYDLSPFDKTLYLDVDMIMFNDISKLFTELEGTDFTIKNNGFNTFDNVKRDYQFVSQKVIKNAYGFIDQRYYHYGSELIYFTKCGANKFYFDMVKEVYNNPKVEIISFTCGKEEIPDEPAFAIASALLKYYPHQSNWKPIYWAKWNDDKVLTVVQMKGDYYGISIGGHALGKPTMALYNNIAYEYSKKAGIINWICKEKNNFLDNRKINHSWRYSI